MLTIFLFVLIHRFDCYLIAKTKTLRSVLNTKSVIKLLKRIVKIFEARRRPVWTVEDGKNKSVGDILERKLRVGAVEGQRANGLG
jgi:hypothetical protein